MAASSKSAVELIAIISLVLSVPLEMGCANSSAINSPVVAWEREGRGGLTSHTAHAKSLADEYVAKYSLDWGSVTKIERRPEAGWVYWVYFDARLDRRVRVSLHEGTASAIEE